MYKVGLQPVLWSFILMTVKIAEYINFDHTVNINANVYFLFNVYNPFLLFSSRFFLRFWRFVLNFNFHVFAAERGDATVSRPSVCLSVRNDPVPCSNTLEFFENNFTAE